MLFISIFSNIFCRNPSKINYLNKNNNNNNFNMILILILYNLIIIIIIKSKINYLKREKIQNIYISM